MESVLALFRRCIFGLAFALVGYSAQAFNVKRTLGMEEASFYNMGNLPVCSFVGGNGSSYSMCAVFYYCRK